MAINALQAVLDNAAREPEAAPQRIEKPVANRPTRAAKSAPAPEAVAEESTGRKFYRPSRDNRRFIGGHFHPAVGKQLKMIAVEDDTTVQALLEEALNLLFVKKGRAKVADISK